MESLLVSLLLVGLAAGLVLSPGFRGVVWRVVKTVGFVLLLWLFQLIVGDERRL